MPAADFHPKFLSAASRHPPLILAEVYQNRGFGHIGSAQGPRYTNRLSLAGTRRYGTKAAFVASVKSLLPDRPMRCCLGHHETKTFTR
jgi:hypothetical protein